MADEEKRQGAAIPPGGESEPADEEPNILNYRGMHEVTATYADAAMVVHTNNDFTIFFFQTQPPPVVSGRMAQGFRTHDAKCVARIVFTPKLMFELFNAMAANLQRAGFLGIKEMQEEGTTEQESE